MPWSELLLLTILIYLYRYLSRRIDERLFIQHGSEVARLSGTGVTKSGERAYWLRFWIQQSTKQLGDPVLDRLVILGLMSLAGIFIAGILLFTATSR